MDNGFVGAVRLSSFNFNFNFDFNFNFNINFDFNLLNSKLLSS